MTDPMGESGSPQLFQRRGALIVAVFDDHQAVGLQEPVRDVDHHPDGGQAIVGCEEREGRVMTAHLDRQTIAL